MRYSHLTREECNRLYQDVIGDNDTPAMRRLCKEDLFFLLTVALNRRDVDRDWIYDRCREVQDAPNENLDLWAREHYKSTIITFGLTIQDILNDPDITVGIFSHTRPAAKKFLRQIKEEFEENEFLKDLFPDVLFRNPKSQSPCWSEDKGIVVIRESNPKEPTIEASGLIDSQPIGSHYKLVVYDDVVVPESVNNSAMIKKTTAMWELSLSLGSEGGTSRYIGTRYHFNDTYKAIMERKFLNTRIHRATIDGTINGEPVFFSQEYLNKKKIQGTYTFGCQYLQDPRIDALMGFKEEWLKYYGEKMKPGSVPSHWNVYIIVDPSSGKKASMSNNLDYTAIEVWALADDGNYYLIDGMRDRLNPTERIGKLFEFVKKYQPTAVGYEEYGMQADIHFIEKEMDRINYHFEITPLGGNKLSKEDRITSLIPLFENHRVWLPYDLIFIDREGRAQDFVKQFVDSEYLAFPVPIHDDMLDCAARLTDPKLNAIFPKCEADERAPGVAISGNREYDPMQTRSERKDTAVTSGYRVVVSNERHVLQSRYSG